MNPMDDPFKKFTEKEILLTFQYRGIDVKIYYTWHMGMMDQEYDATHLEIMGSDVFNMGKANDEEIRRLTNAGRKAIDAHLDKKMPIRIALIWAETWTI
ncbi:MAG TPA: hypothetical protein PKL22_10590 [Saprospiraceae bacterium]|nr:hypothetical protein [Saprospiraceae bacterium]